MVCRNCGLEMPDNAKFCLECGTRVSVESKDSNDEVILHNTDSPVQNNQVNEQVFKQSPPAPKKNNKLVGILIGVSGIALIVILAIVIGVNNKGGKVEETSTTFMSTSIGIEIPNIANVDESTAKTLLAGKGIIPIVEYMYDDIIKEGNVIKTSPELGSFVDVDSSVKIFISKGPSYIPLKNGTISWSHLKPSAGEDEWNFTEAYIKEGTLYIKCTDVKIAVAMKWDDEDNEGNGYGDASINDTFDKTVPIIIRYSKKSFARNEKQDISLEIPLTDLNIQKPTDMYLKLYIRVDGKQERLEVDFSLTW